MVTDPIADFLARLRNASEAGKEEVRTPYAKILERIGALLAQEGFVDELAHQGRGPKKTLVVKLRYIKGKPAIEHFRRVSRPGRRVYRQVSGLRPVRSGFGVAILSTPQGLLTSGEARKRNVGGEVLCEVW